MSEIILRVENLRKEFGDVVPLKIFRWKSNAAKFLR